jgi:hypothetical protein
MAPDGSRSTPPWTWDRPAHEAACPPSRRARFAASETSTHLHPGWHHLSRSLAQVILVRGFEANSPEDSPVWAIDHGRLSSPSCTSNAKPLHHESYKGADGFLGDVLPEKDGQVDERIGDDAACAKDVVARFLYPRVVASLSQGLSDLAVLSSCNRPLHSIWGESHAGHGWSNPRDGTDGPYEGSRTVPPAGTRDEIASHDPSRAKKSPACAGLHEG